MGFCIKESALTRPDVRPKEYAVKSEKSDGEVTQHGRLRNATNRPSKR